MQKLVFLLASLLATGMCFVPSLPNIRVSRQPALKMADEPTISAKMVSELRAKTDSPMMECKKALIEAKGDFAKAEEILRVKLGNKASKVATRIASNGVVIAMIDGDQGCLFEANCETDFVSKNPDFIDFTKQVATAVIKSSPADVASLNALPMSGKTVETTRSDLVGKIGENMSIRRFQRIGGTGTKLASYVHGGSGPDRASVGSIAVIVEYIGDEQAAKDIAMHVACNKPSGLTPADVPAEKVAEERRVAELKAVESGKPPAIAQKMVEGQVQKFLKEVTLTSQPFVKDTTITVEAYLKAASTTIKSYAFYVVGEGLEKKEDTFVQEVAAAQAKIAAAQSK